MPESLPTDLLEQRLPDWYRAVSVDLSGERLVARKAAIHQFAKDLSTGQALDAAAYASGHSERGDALIGPIRDAARETDPTFAADRDDAEPPIFVACSIAHHVVTWPDSNVSSLCSIGLLSAEFRGDHGVIPGQELGTLSRRAALRGGAARTRDGDEAEGRREEGRCDFAEEPRGSH